VAAAGGVAVLAHPWARGGRRVLGADTIASLVDDGLAGLEAWHRDHSADDAVQLNQLADRLGLVTTGSSDYHGTGKVDHELGCHTTPPEQLQRLLELMERAAAAARRDDPSVQPAAAVTV
jgi:hypothetical protein